MALESPLRLAALSTPLPSPLPSPSPSPRRKPAANRRVSGQENVSPLSAAAAALSASPGSPPERRSFQGDHHRHRYKMHASQPSPRTRPSPKSHHSRPSPASSRPSPNASPASPSAIARSHRAPRPTPHHLGAPTNAHYSPHYGAAGQQQQKPSPGSRRKPPPSAGDPQSADHHPRAFTPSRSVSPSPHEDAHANSPLENSPRNSIRSFVELDKSRSPSPCPSPRNALVKKIGSVLSAPFRSSHSRRGSDVSDIGMPSMAKTPSPSGKSKSDARPSPGNYPQQEKAANALAIVSDHETFAPPIREHLPRMPSPSGESSQRSGVIEKQPNSAPTQFMTRHCLQDSIVVPNEFDRVLRVVNGLSTSSTQATIQQHERPDVRDVIQDFATSNLQSAQSFSTTTTSINRDYQELEHKLVIEQNRVKVLERLVEDQTTRLDQFKNWSTAKINTLELSLKSNDQLLQTLERQQYQDKPSKDIKSNYLIALQKDFVDLYSRVVALEAAAAASSQTNAPSSLHSFPASQEISSPDTSSARWLSSVSPSTQPTSVAAIEPISPIPLRSQAPSSQLLRTYDEDISIPSEELLSHSPSAPVSTLSPLLPTDLALDSTIAMMTTQSSARQSSSPSSDPDKTRQAASTKTTQPRRPSWQRSSTDRKDLQHSPNPSTADMTTPKKRSTWQASSPANLASKLVPLSPPSPKTGTGPLSPRPRYTSALGSKNASPLSFGRNGTSFGGAGSSPAGIKRASAGPTVSYGSTDPLKVIHHHVAAGGRSTTPSSTFTTAPNTPRPWQPLELTKHAITGGHSKRFSVTSNPNYTAPSSPAMGGIGIFPSGPSKKPVGDLIKMFDKK